MTGQERAPGFFITFEGPDGSGKTTQIRLLAQWLRAQSMEPVLLRNPGSTPLGERIRGIVLDSQTDTTMGALAPLAELSLMFADRAQSIAEVIRPALAAGRIILCDRYTDSSEAYQGVGRGLGSERVLALHRLLCDDLQPDLTILLLPSVERALARAQQRNDRARQRGVVDENRFEREGESFFRRVHAAYEAIAARTPERVAAFAGDSGIEAVAEQIRSTVEARWAAFRGRRTD